MTQSAVCAFDERLAPSLFTGKERDSESGNDYFEARYYASNMGRFLSPDWASNPQAVPYASYINPQTLNLYSYMRNNPLGGFDPDGHDSLNEREEIMAEDEAGLDAGTAQYEANIAAWMTPQAPVAQQQDATARREQAAEAKAKKNMDKYGPANNGLVLRPVEGSCGGGNNNCQYELVGSGSEKYYVYEHQTSSVLGGDPHGDADYVTPGSGGKANAGIFYDDIRGGSIHNLDTYRFFTISSSQTYNPSDQRYVPITELGGTHGFEHMFGNGGPVYINGSTNLSPSN